MTPVAGIASIGEYPVLYVNTADSAVIDQKEVYIDAVGWLDGSLSGKCESVGTSEEPLVLGIRGRGNASWLADGPKPYKMKFDKKQAFFGRTKNKHWVLLPLSSYSEFYNNMVGLEIGKQLGMAYLPARFLIQLVLNGQFQGLYMLSEHIRVDEGRVDIYEQPDNNEDESTIPYGWLVEVDNYSDPCQIRFPNLNHPDKFTRITHHTPEVLSPQQNEWLFGQFNGFAVAAHEGNKLSREWEKYIDVKGLAKYFVAQEILHNFDAYVGSWFLHKDKIENDETWHLGPLWDLGWSLDRTITTLVAEDAGRVNNYMDDIIKFPRFLKAAKATLNEYVETLPEGWVDTFCDSLSMEIDRGLALQRQLWPDLASRLGNVSRYPKQYFKENLAYLVGRFNDDLRTCHLDVEIIREEGVYNLEDVDASKDAVVLIDGMSYTDPDVKWGQSVVLTTKSNCGRIVKSILVDGVEKIDEIENEALLIDNITKDLSIVVTFSPITFIPVTELSIDRDYVELLPAESVKLQFTSYPSNATPFVVRWETSDSGIVEVGAGGLITAQSPGEAEVKVKVYDDVFAVCRVKVLEPDVDYGDDQTEQTERIYTSPGKTLNLIEFVNDTLGTAYWISADSLLLPITKEGMVIPQKYGETVVRGKDKYGRTTAYFDVMSCPEVRIEHAGGTIYTHHVLYNSRPTLFIGGGKDCLVSGVTHDGEIIEDGRITEDGYYTSIKPITENSVINVTLEVNVMGDNNDEGILSESRVRLYVINRELTIEGARPDARVTITDLSGHMVFDEVNTHFVFESRGIYLVRIEGETRTFKIIIEGG